MSIARRVGRGQLLSQAVTAGNQTNSPLKTETET